MHRIVYGSLAVLMVTAGTASLSGQIGSELSSGPVRMSPRPRPLYIATFKITQVQTLANGATITHETTEISARDSQGRSLRSTTDLTPPAQGMQPGTRASVSDPVGGLESSWDSRTMKARVVKSPPRDQRDGCWADDSGAMRIQRYSGPRPGAPAPNGTVLSNGSTLVPAMRDKPEVEDLGTSTIQGFEATGQRLTTTIPAGEQGNDQPLVSVHEIWSSRQLGLTLREMNDDPRRGKLTRELVSLTVGEPDPSLFQPPDGYEVKTEELHQVTCPEPR